MLSSRQPLAPAISPVLPSLPCGEASIVAPKLKSIFQGFDHLGEVHGVANEERSDVEKGSQQGLDAGTAPETVWDRMSHPP